jgi:hypothetical protein
MNNGGGSALSNASNDANQNMSPSPAGSPVQSCGSAPDPASNQTVSPDKKHWIQIEMLDKEGRPVKGEDFKLSLPDGTVIEGSLDDRGRSRFGGIDPGSCTVTFPNLDKDSWEPK